MPIFFLICVTNSKAQNIFLSGKIVNQSGIPLEGVHISLILPCKDSLILSFTSSDQNGFYTMILKYPDLCEKLILNYSILGYLKKEISTIITDNPKINIDAILTPQEISLNEVIVKSKSNGFNQSKDTTRYHISQYIDGTERKLEDVLKKLPGISVSENGTVSFQGKNIDKILVEGDDFFSKNYTILSKNVSANLIESIEALDNFNDEKLLKGISRSDKIVLNLKLKKDKATFFGDTEIGYGSDQRYNTSLNVFSFYKKAKFALLGNANNTGEEAVADIQYNLSSNNGNSYLPNEQALGIHTPFNDKIPVNLEVSQNRYLINKAFTEGLQLNYAFSNKLKANFYSFCNLDNQKLSLNKNTQYLFPDSSFSLSEQSIYRIKPQTINSNLKLNYHLTDSSTLAYNLSSEVKSPDFMYNLELYPIASSNQRGLINGVSEERINNLNNRLTYTRRVSESKAIIFEGAYFRYKNDLNLKQDTNRFAYLNDIPSTWKIQQNADIYVQSYEATLKILGSYKQHTYFVSANVNQNLSKLNSFYFGSFEAVTTPRESLNQIFKKDLNFVFEIRDIIKWKDLELDYGFRILRSDQKFQNLKGPNSEKLKAYFFLPKLSLKYIYDSYNSFTIAYEQNNINSSVTDLYSNNIISDYLSVTKGIGALNNNLLQDFSFRYKYSNSNNQWIMNFMSSLHIENKPYLTATSVQDQLLVNTYMPSKVGSYFFYNRFHSDKYIGFLQSNWRVMLSSSQTKINSVINDGGLQKNILNTISVSTAINTAFDIPVNFHVAGTYNSSRLDLSTTKVRNNLFKYDISANLNFFNVLQIKVIGSNYNWSSQSNKATSSFLDVKAGYRKAKQKWAIGLIGSNILNAKNIAFNESDNFILSQNSYELLQRYFLLSFNYSF